MSQAHTRAEMRLVAAALLQFQAQQLRALAEDINDSKLSAEDRDATVEAIENAASELELAAAPLMD